MSSDSDCESVEPIDPFTASINTLIEEEVKKKVEERTKQVAILEAENKRLEEKSVKQRSTCEGLFALLIPRLYFFKRENDYKLILVMCSTEGCNNKACAVIRLIDDFIRSDEAEVVKKANTETKEKFYCASHAEVILKRGGSYGDYKKSNLYIYIKEGGYISANTRSTVTYDLNTSKSLTSRGYNKQLVETVEYNLYCYNYIIAPEHTVGL